MKHHLEWLGHTVTDTVTGFKGIVSSVSFELYGCVQALVTPKQDAKGVLPSQCWFDTTRLKKTSKVPCMKIPSYDKFVVAGGQKLPIKSQ